MGKWHLLTQAKHSVLPPIQKSVYLYIYICCASHTTPPGPLSADYMYPMKLSLFSRPHCFHKNKTIFFSSTAWCLQFWRLTLWNVHTWLPNPRAEGRTDCPGDWSRAQRPYKAVRAAGPGSEADHGGNPEWTWSWTLTNFQTMTKNDSVQGTRSLILMVNGATWAREWTTCQQKDDIF